MPWSLTALLAMALAVAACAWRDGAPQEGPTAAAIGNAFADATGVRLRELPFSRERVRAALQG